MANKMSPEQLTSMCKNAEELGFRSERLILLDQRLTSWAKDDFTPSIAVKILRHGKTAFEGAYGIIAPDQEPDSLKTDTIFPICSMTKPITGALISILQEDGLIDLNEPVRKYIPEFTSDTYSAVRIWHLLTHTSGIIGADLNKNFDEYVKNTLQITIPDYDEDQAGFKEAIIQIREKFKLPYMDYSYKMQQDTFYKIALSIPPTHKPQKVMSYCNAGYDLVKEIIVRVSGLSIDEYAQQKLFQPLKMDNSHFIFPREKLNNYVTRGKEYTGSNWLNKGVLDSECGGSGLKSNVHDMTRFGQMMLNNGILDGERVLSPASVREITSDHNKLVSQSVYNGELLESTWGLGWNIKGNKKDDCGMLRSPSAYEHGGFGCTRLLCDPEYDIVATYFTVCKTDCYKNSANFNNMVISAIV